MYIVTDDAVRKRIEQFIALAGSAKNLAIQWKISPQYLCDLRKGKRNIPDGILERLGCRRVIVEKSYTLRRAEEGG